MRNLEKTFQARCHFSEGGATSTNITRANTIANKMNADHDKLNDLRKFSSKTSELRTIVMASILTIMSTTSSSSSWEV